MSDLFRIDHLAYLRSCHHRRATHAAFRRAIRERVTGRVLILHEANGSCCRREPWEATAARIRDAIAADGIDRRTLWVALDSEEGAA